MAKIEKDEYSVIIRKEDQTISMDELHERIWNYFFDEMDEDFHSHVYIFRIKQDYINLFNEWPFQWFLRNLYKEEALSFIEDLKEKNIKAVLCKDKEASQEIYDKTNFIEIEIPEINKSNAQAVEDLAIKLSEFLIATRRLPINGEVEFLDSLYIGKTIIKSRFDEFYERINKLLKESKLEYTITWKPNEPDDE